MMFASTQSARRRCKNITSMLWPSSHPSTVLFNACALLRKIVCKSGTKDTSRPTLADQVRSCKYSSRFTLSSHTLPHFRARRETALTLSQRGLPSWTAHVTELSPMKVPSRKISDPKSPTQKLPLQRQKGDVTRQPLCVAFEIAAGSLRQLGVERPHRLSYGGVCFATGAGRRYVLVEEGTGS